MINILFIVDSISHGGAGRVVSLLANAFNKNKYKVTVLLMDPFIESEKEYSIDDEVEKVYFQVNPHKNTHTQILSFLRKTTKEKKIDVCFAFLNVYAEYAIVATMFTRTKVVACERNDPNSSPAGRLFRLFRTPLYSLSSKVVCQTEEMVNFFPKFIEKKCKIILNPINPYLPDPYDGAKINKVVSVGKLTEQKNYEMGIRAFAEFHVLYPEFIYEIYGEGTERERLQNIIDNLGLTDKVFLRGHITNPYEYIKDAKMYLMTSNYEGLSNALIEALALGIPTITTNHPIGGAKMLINNGVNGLLVPVNDVKQLTEAMIRLASSETISCKMAMEGRKIRDVLAIGTIVYQWEELVEALMGDLS